LHAPRSHRVSYFYTIFLFLFFFFFLFSIFFFFFNDTATTEIYTLSLHDALPIFNSHRSRHSDFILNGLSFDFSELHADRLQPFRDRKSTRLNSSHLVISYAVFCLKKKKKKK